jgi:hypothetical protein
MLRFILLVGLTTLLGGCAKPADPYGDISRSVVILLCTTEPGSTNSRVTEVLKNGVPESVRVANGDILNWPLLDKEFTRKYRARLVFFEDSEPRFLAQFSGPRSEAPVVDGRIGLYGLSLDEFRSIVARSIQAPNKAPEPTPTSVTPRATEGALK